MSFDPQKLSENFLELASEQRLRIILNLLTKKTNLSSIAKELDSTASEAHRNLNRLVKAGIITKDLDGMFTLTNYGKAICDQISSFAFLQENRKFFEEHGFGDLPIKFIQRAGALKSKQHIKGFVRVLEKWKNVHFNAKNYIYNILAEVPYSQDIIDIITSKLQNGVKIRSVISEHAIMPTERKEIFEKKNFQNYIKNEALERRMSGNVSVVIVLNEKEGCVIFPKRDGKPDMSEMFYSTEPIFHEWCLDYFNDCWNNSSSFQESKLKEQN